MRAAEGRQEAMVARPAGKRQEKGVRMRELSSQKCRRASNGHSSSVAGQCKILQGMGCVVAKGDAAKVVQVRVMAAGLGLIGVGEAHDLATISITELSGPR